MIKVPELAPGCFGSALAFSKDDMICKACPFSVKCEPAHQKSKALLKARFGIGVKEKQRPKAASVTAASTELTLGEKTKEILRFIEGMKIGVHDKLKEGINPFGDKLKFMTAVCFVLLRKPSSTEQMMTAAVATVMKCPEQEAQTLMKIGVEVLKHLGAITEKEGVYALRRD